MNDIEPLTITVRQSSPGRPVLELSGPCDYETAQELRRAAEEALAAEPAPGCLTLDLTDVETCDSSGLAALIWIQRRATAGSVRLHLVGVSAHLDRFIDITGLDEYFADARRGDSCQDRAAAR
jgi:anti-sigma B factor antagonist